MLYRYCEDRYFFASEQIHYDGKALIGVGITFMFLFYDKEGQEIVIGKNEKPETFTVCDYDYTAGFSLRADHKAMEENGISSVTCEPVEAYLTFDGIRKPNFVPVDMAREILKGHAFQFRNNIPAHVFAYTFSNV